MTKTLMRFINGVKLGVWAVKNPDPLTGNMFEMLSKILSLLMQVATEDRPYMTEIIITIDDDIKQPIVHIWAGNGASADPFKRIKELSEENIALREMVKVA
jgi:hypothetical protein